MGVRALSRPAWPFRMDPGVGAAAVRPCPSGRGACFRGHGDLWAPNRPGLERRARGRGVPASSLVLRGRGPGLLPADVASAAKPRLSRYHRRGGQDVHIPVGGCGRGCGALGPGFSHDSAPGLLADCPPSGVPSAPGCLEPGGSDCPRLGQGASYSVQRGLPGRPPDSPRPRRRPLAGFAPGECRLCGCL